MYAVIATGGKQYRVSEGDEIYVEKLDVAEGDEVKFEEILAVGEEGKVKVGTPVVKGASVTGKAVKNGRGKKIHILTYRSKKGSKRAMGHRQPFTKVQITTIQG